MADLYPAISGEVQGYIDKLKSKGNEFSQAYQVHLANYERAKDNPELLAKWNSIKNYSDNVKKTIQTINSAVDSSVNWLSGAFGMAGISALPVAGVVLSASYLIASIAALTWVIGQISQFNTLVNKGIDPTKQGTFFGDLGTIVQWGVIGFAVYAIWKKWGK